MFEWVMNVLCVLVMLGNNLSALGLISGLSTQNQQGGGGG